MKRLILILSILALFVLAFSSCDLLIGAIDETGIVTGIVYDYDNEAGLGGVYVSAVGTDVSTTTSSSGYFTIELPTGLQVLRFTKSGYSFYDLYVLVIADETVSLTEDVVGYAPLGVDEIRIVLTWGSYPYDLDSHLYTPATAEVYYWNETATDAYLDWDDTSGYGPETITITNQQSGTYYYSVYNYSQVGSFITTKATVKVYNSSGLWRTYEAEDIIGDGTQDWWRVFSLNGATITEIGTFNDTAGNAWAGIE
ncbi:MAG: YfaP family protein [Sphaerochaetaceae bacterium]